MSSDRYQAQELSNLLESIQDKQASGVLYIDARIDPEKPAQSCVLIWKDGRVLYGGKIVPDAQNLVRLLEQKLSQEGVASTVAFAMRQVTEQTSLRALLEQLVQMQLYSWEQIESTIYSQLLLTIEQILPYPGKFRFDSSTQLNFCRGVELSKLMLDINQRQEQWYNLRPIIMSMDAVPSLKTDALAQIAEPNVRQHLQEWVNGQRSLVDIAKALNKDPLTVAKSYIHWVRSGWIDMQNSSTATAQILRPTVLAVDDSTVMQEQIERILTGYCRVLLASNAVDALNIIDREDIALLLLDVNMPKIDGIELCRIIRGIPQFQALPIVMVTARNSSYDRIKYKLAGANEFLAKPFEAEELIQIILNYLPSKSTSHGEDVTEKFDLSKSF